MIGERISHYKIIEKIGEGGMGVVYLAEDTKLERQVALKFLPAHIGSNSEALARFKSEAKAAASLHHPNIITVHEIGSHQGREYFAMAYIPGMPLSEPITGRELSIGRAIDITLQLCDALEEAHMAGIIHRDLKPDNVIIDSRGRAYLLDFGLAIRVDVTRLTQDGSTIGTLSYMSPEQLLGEEVDRRTDIFSLGAILYEMIGGRPAFPGDYAAAIQYQILNETPQPLAGSDNPATPELNGIILKALAKEPNARFQTMVEFAASLKPLRGSTPSTTGEVVPRQERIIEFARARGHDWQHTTLDSLDLGDKKIDVEQFISVDEAIQRMEKRDERMARIVRLHFFAGLSVQEIASILGITERIVRRDWNVAHAWLYRDLSNEDREKPS
jgi:serine/threonine protein kinase